MAITTHQIRRAIEGAERRHGSITASQCFSELGGCITSARNVLNRAVELEFMTVTKRVPQESLYKLTGKPLSDLQDESQGLVARFEELLSAWGIPHAAPKGSPGRVHKRFLKYSM